MRAALIVAPIAAMLVPFAAPAGAAPAPETSWGKAGVSAEEYGADAARCLRLVEAADLSGTRAAEALVLASRRIENALPENGPADADPLTAARQVSAAVEQARPAERIAEIRALMQTAMDACLIELGYHRFRLTEAQRDRLSHLRYGRAERRAYLHALASDPDVLARQGE